MKTKDKILITALELFNSTNTQAATTNHIAAAMGISPGNLHYHYKNREAIIYALYAQMQAKCFPDPDFVPSSIQELVKSHNHWSSVFWEYKFFHRELLFLLSRDESLKAKYIENNLHHKERITKMLNDFHDKGWLNLPYDNVVTHVCDIIMVFTQFWHPYLETMGEELNEYNLKGDMRRIEGALRSFMTKEGLEILADIER